MPATPVVSTQVHASPELRIRSVLGLFCLLNKKPGRALLHCCIVARPLGEGSGTHSSTLAWKIPWMEEPDRLQSMGSLRVRHDWATSLSPFTFMHWRRETHFSVLAWRIPGMGEPGGLPFMGLHRVRHDWSELAAAAARPLNCDSKGLGFNPSLPLMIRWTRQASFPG